jgi:quercetin dioxygenase-like cupin family protein
MNMSSNGKLQSGALSAEDGQRAFRVFCNRGDVTDQDMTFVLQINRPGSRSLEDVHDLEQWFFVHKGHVRFTIGGEACTAGPGDMVFVPRNAVHWHEPLGDEGVELLVINHWPRDSQDQMGWNYAEDEPSVKSSGGDSLRR